MAWVWIQLSYGDCRIGTIRDVEFKCTRFDQKKLMHTKSKVTRAFPFIFILFIHFAQLLTSPALQKKLHNICVKWVVKNSTDLKIEKKALLCGDKIKSERKKITLSKMGLIHIFVVSGAHLNFYKSIFSLLLPKPIATFLLCLLLPLYCITCHASPPILRATAEYFFRILNSKFKIRLLSSELVLYSAIFTATLHFSNATSVSLLLSWACSLIIRRTEFNIKTFIIFLVSSPILLLFILPNPLVTLPSFFLSYIMSLTLLPLTLLSMGTPEIISESINDLLQFCFDLMTFISDDIQLKQLGSSKSYNSLIFFVWIYILILNVLFINRDKSRAINTH